MSTLVPRKDRRFPLGIFPMVIYIIIASVSASVLVIGTSIFSSIALGYNWLLIIFTAIVASLLAGIGSLIGSFLYWAMIVMLGAKVHHWTQVFPGVIALGLAVTAFFRSAISTLSDLIKTFIGPDRIYLDSVTFATLFNVFSNKAVMVISTLCTLISVIAWICYIALVLVTTLGKGKKSPLAIFALLGACLAFVGGIISNFASVLNVIRVIIMNWIRGVFSTPVFINNIFGLIGALIFIVAGIFGTIAMLMICTWFINPAKRGYVPAAPAEEEAPVENESVETLEATEQEPAEAEETVSETVE